MREQSDYERDPVNGKGRLHVRNCYTGCEAVKSRDALSKVGVKPNPKALQNACDACTLRPEWTAEANAVVALCTLPDAAIGWPEMPYWLAHGIGYQRALNRGGF